MKKVAIIICLLIIAIGIITLALLKINNKEQEEYSDSLVGIYYNNNWNEKEVTLILNEDGTCKYPTGETDYKWSVSNKDILITKGEQEKQIQVFMEYEATEEEIMELKEALSKIEGINTITFISKEDAYNTMKEKVGEDIMIGVEPDIFSVSFKVIYVDSNNEIYNKISQLDGVREINGMTEEVDINNHKATIVNNGLILYDHLFVKIK